MTELDEDDLRAVFRRWKLRFSQIRASEDHRDRMRQVFLGAVLVVGGLFIGSFGSLGGPDGRDPSTYQLGGGRSARRIGLAVYILTTDGIVPVIFSLCAMGFGLLLIKRALTPGAPLLGAHEVRCEICGDVGEWWDGEQEPTARCATHAPPRRPR